MNEKNEYVDGSVYLKTTYKHDNNGNIIELISFKDNSIWYHYSYCYDNNGNIVESYTIINRGEASNYIQVYTYEYDEHKNWIKKSVYDNGNPIILEEREIVYW